MHESVLLNDIFIDGAIFSEDRVYRYLLRRKVGVQRTTCLFIMLNPSTADEKRNDPTVSRCIGFAKHWGFGRLEVCNIFAYRATDPGELYQLSEYYPANYNIANGPENIDYIRHAVVRADRVVCAWGNHGELFNRGIEVRNLVMNEGKFPLAFKITNKGQPIHPLYQKADAPLITWTG